MYDNSPKSKYSPLSNTKLVEEARKPTECGHEGSREVVSVPGPVDSGIVVDIGTLEIEEGV